MESFVQFLGGCGSFSIAEKSGIARFTVSNFSDIANTIIPTLEEYPI